MKIRGIYEALNPDRIIRKWYTAAEVGEELKIFSGWVIIVSRRWHKHSRRMIVFGVTRSNGEYFTITRLAVADGVFRVPHDYTGIGETYNE